MLYDRAETLVKTADIIAAFTAEVLYGRLTFFLSFLMHEDTLI